MLAIHRHYALRREGNELGSAATQLKFAVSDGKMRLANVLGAKLIKSLLRAALTDKIADRETFMKGIDCSYYYEQED